MFESIFESACLYKCTVGGATQLPMFFTSELGFWGQSSTLKVIVKIILNF